MLPAVIQLRCRPALVALACLGVALSCAAQSSKQFRIAMRDGVLLATDAHLPAEGEGPWPCLLVRTPYNRLQAANEYASWTKSGYAVVIQDTRGRYGSQGKAMAFQTDAWGELQDGYDTMAWLVKQSFCNGRIGTLGSSALGIAQVFMAPTDPPGLVAQHIVVACASLYHDAMYQGGVWRKNQVDAWMRMNAHPDALKLSLEHREYDELWQNLDAVPQAHKVRVPGVHQGGWFDTFSEGTIANFVSRQTRGGPGAKGTQKLVMGPWAHGGGGAKMLGEFPMPAEGRRPPVDVGSRRWFDHYLKGLTNGVERAPAVQYYVMGPFDGSPSKGHRWKTADAWPVPARSTAWYLEAPGALQLQPPAANASSAFTHRPDDPVPTIGGRNLILPSGPRDQRALETRPDVLTWTTPALAEDMEVTGKITARVWLWVEKVSETHLAARLTDVYPDGKSVLIAEGIQRVRWGQRPAADPSGPMEVEVDLWSTSMVFARGHRLRLSLSASNFPRWDVANPKDGQPVAHRIHTGPDHPSRLLLPVVADSP